MKTYDKLLPKLPTKAKEEQIKAMAELMTDEILIKEELSRLKRIKERTIKEMPDILNYIWQIPGEGFKSFFELSDEFILTRLRSNYDGADTQEILHQIATKRKLTIIKKLK